jgi:hypothetical protein
VLGGIPAENSLSVWVDLDPDIAGAAPLNAFTLPAFTVSFLFILLSTASSLACTDKKL